MLLLCENRVILTSVILLQYTRVAAVVLIEVVKSPTLGSAVLDKIYTGTGTKCPLNINRSDIMDHLHEAELEEQVSNGGRMRTSVSVLVSS